MQSLLKPLTFVKTAPEKRPELEVEIYFWSEICEHTAQLVPKLTSTSPQLASS